MEPTVADIIEVMESVAPSELAEQWDNVGLQVGQKDWPVRSVWVALDPAPEVVAAACENHVDLLITHHPLIFHPLKSIDFSTPIGTIIRLAIKKQMAIFSAHTNFDAVADGLNDILAAKIGLVDLNVLSTAAAPSPHGIGRVGNLRQPSTLLAFARDVSRYLGGCTVKYSGRPDLRVYRAAICTGSGGSLMGDFLSSGADVFVSGDLRYHDARAAQWAEVGLIDIGHFASEHLMVNALADRLQKIFKAKGMRVKVQACDLEKDPFMMV